MPTTKEKTVARKPKRKGHAAAMPIVLRDVPAGFHWGWYSREDARMHVQTLDGDTPYKVWLEEKGDRVFQAVGVIPRKILRPLQEKMLSHRPLIEAKWVRFMIDQAWLALHVSLPLVSLVAYPHLPTKFVRKIDLRTWLTPEQLATLSSDNIRLDRETAALRLWSDRSEEQVPYDVRLSTLLWRG